MTEVPMAALFVFKKALERVETLEKKVARLEKYFYGYMVEQCVLAGQIRAEVKHDNREDDEAKKAQEGLLDPGPGLHGQGAGKVQDPGQGERGRVPESRMRSDRMGGMSD